MTHALTGRARGMAVVLTAGLLAGFASFEVPAQPTGGPAEYAVRWDSDQGTGPKRMEDVAKLLAVSSKKTSAYRVQYATVPRPMGLPQSVKVIARERTALTGKDAGEIESSYKLRASKPPARQLNSKPRSSHASWHRAWLRLERARPS